MIVRMFRVFVFLFLTTGISWAQSSRMMPELKFLKDSQVIPGKLTIERDSVRFTVEGKVPMESVLTPRNPRVRLFYKAAGRADFLGEFTLAKKVTHFAYSQDFVLRFEPWMESAYLELEFFQGKQNPGQPEERKVIARGINAPQSLVKIGTAIPEEPVPVIGIPILTQTLDLDSEQKSEFLFQFAPGSSSLRSATSNAGSLVRLERFLLDFPKDVTVTITGLHSPETADLQQANLSEKRSQEVKENLISRFVQLAPEQLKVSHREKDFFDLRILLRDYEGISQDRKEEFYAVLLNREDFALQKERISKIPGFEQVRKDLYPKLRVAKVEVTGKPVSGLTFEQTNRLKEAMQSTNGQNKLSFVEWNQAAESTQNIDEKAAIYSKMTELYKSAIPYNNLAVIRMRQAQFFLDQGSKDVLWEEAERLLKIAFRLEPNPHSLHNLGQILALRGDYWAAYQQLSQASTLTQDAFFIQKNEALRGALDILRGDFKLATLRFEKPSKDPHVLFNKGLAFFLLKDYSQASAAFEESVSFGRELGYGYYGLAMIAVSSGQAEVAIIHLQKAAENNQRLKARSLYDPIFEELRNTKEFFEVLSK